MNREAELDRPSRVACSDLLGHNLIYFKTDTNPSCILLAAFVLVTGCVTHRPDPLAGWKPDFSRQTSQVIVDDYQDYIHKLPPRQSGFVGSVEWFEDGTGQHAIDIGIGVNGRWWRHVLIYDKDNKRIKVIKYKTGWYQS